jgi:hypothetical protein
MRVSQARLKSLLRKAGRPRNVSANAAKIRATLASEQGPPVKRTKGAANDQRGYHGGRQHGTLPPGTKAAAVQSAHTFATEYGRSGPRRWQDRRRPRRTDRVLRLPASTGSTCPHSHHPIESTFSTVRLRTRVAKGPGSRAAGVAMAFKLICPRTLARGQRPHLIALVRAGARFENGQLVERPDESGGDQQAA